MVFTPPWGGGLAHGGKKSDLAGFHTHIFGCLSLRQPPTDSSPNNSSHQTHFPLNTVTFVGFFISERDRLQISEETPSGPFFSPLSRHRPFSGATAGLFHHRLVSLSPPGATKITSGKKRTPAGRRARRVTRRRPDTEEGTREEAAGERRCHQTAENRNIDLKRCTLAFIASRA